MRPSARAASCVVLVCLVGMGGSRAAPSGSARTARTESTKKTSAAPISALQFIHGTVVVSGGKRYTGVLRWGDEGAAFWDDRFRGAKAELPYMDRLPEDKRPHLKIRIIGFLPVDVSEEGESGRQFVARFGDIKEIRPLEGHDVELAMKSGSKYHLSGGSEDIGAVVHVDDPVAGSNDLRWESIQQILLEPVPARGSEPDEPKASRLFGDVTTEAGTFRGFIQWDGQECLSTDRLDGDADSGRISLEMGGIRSIEKKDPGASRVETSDGRKLDLYGTNDVNESIRGIFIEDERFGRVRVSWHAFRRLDFRPPAATVRRYDDYPAGRPLRGTVTDRAGKRWPGTIVFDLDESETWEMLDGARQGVEYSIPFERVRTVEPLADRTTMVTLRSGQKLQLDSTQDVSEKNAGILVRTTGPESERYIPWDGVARIDLD